MEFGHRDSSSGMGCFGFCGLLVPGAGEGLLRQRLGSRAGGRWVGLDLNLGFRPSDLQVHIKADIFDSELKWKADLSPNACSEILQAASLPNYSSSNLTPAMQMAY